MGTSTDGFRLGAVFPAREIGTDVAGLRAWATGVEALGFDHAVVPDHVVGVDPGKREAGWDAQWPHGDGHVRRPYTHTAEWHEPFVVLGFLAAVCRLELVTGVLVLPQRQTVLVAKQAAELALLARGGIRLGVGIGWNPAEYEALGMPFGERGRLIEEQIPLLRRLWTEESVVVDGTYHRMDAVGIAPRPGELPLWMGGGTSFDRGLDALRVPLERIGRLADGWYLDSAAVPSPDVRAALAVIERARADAGRPGPIPVDGRILLATCQGPTAIAERIDGWMALGVTHITVDSMGTGCTTAADHLQALNSVVDVAGRAVA